MNSNLTTLEARDLCFENLAAELSDAAYRVVLQYGVGQEWIEIELDLWRAMTQAIRNRS